MKFIVGDPRIGMIDVEHADFILTDYDYDIDDPELPDEVMDAIAILRNYAKTLNKWGDLWLFVLLMELILIL